LPVRRKLDDILTANFTLLDVKSLSQPARP